MAWWLPYNRFAAIQGDIDFDLESIIDLLNSRWLQIWNPGNVVVIDESIYEYLGESPVHVSDTSLLCFSLTTSRYIPRKPHPNGLLSYGMAGYTAIERLPILLCLDPHLPGHRCSPHLSLETLVKRLTKAHPTLSPHVVADSAFGSFSTIEKMRNLGAHATFSMPMTQRPWLWEALAWDCPLTSGRTAQLPILDGAEHVFASIFHVKSESDKIIDIRTLTSGWTWSVPESAEWAVASVGARRANDAGVFEYETRWGDGTTTWQQARSFMDEDGTFNISWLKVATAEDVRDALVDLNLEALAGICDAQGWKVSPHFFRIPNF